MKIRITSNGEVRLMEEKVKSNFIKLKISEDCVFLKIYSFKGETLVEVKFSSGKTYIFKRNRNNKEDSPQFIFMRKEKFYRKYPHEKKHRRIQDHHYIGGFHF